MKLQNVDNYSSKESFGSKTMLRKPDDSSTFMMTQVNNIPTPSRKKAAKEERGSLKPSRNNKNSKSRQGLSSGNDESQNDPVQNIEQTIELSDHYEDEDFHNYFEKQSLLSYLNFLEDDNLFKIHLVQEED